MKNLVLAFALSMVAVVPAHAQSSNTGDGTKTARSYSDFVQIVVDGDAMYYLRRNGNIVQFDGSNLPCAASASMS